MLKSHLGKIYLGGQGMPRDYEKAIVWLKKAADRGDADAQSELGTLLVAVQAYREAISWFQKAADQGQVSAQNSLAAMYENGQGVPQNYEQAALLYRKAAGNGDARAMFNIGLMNFKGHGVPTDFVQAEMWFNLATAHASDLQVRYQAAASRDELATKMTSAQIAEAQRLASEWKPK